MCEELVKELVTLLLFLRLLWPGRGRSGARLDQGGARHHCRLADRSLKVFSLFVQYFVDFLVHEAFCYFLLLHTGSFILLLFLFQLLQVSDNVRRDHALDKLSVMLLSSCLVLVDALAHYVVHI